MRNVLKPFTNVNPDSAQKIAAVYQAVRVLCDGVATLPLAFFKKEVGGNIGPLKNDFARLFKMEVDSIARVTAHKFFQTTIKTMVLRGNSFGIIHRQPARIEFVPQSLVTILEDNSTLEIFYLIQGRRGSLPNGLFTSNDVLHFRNISDHPLIGESCLKHASQSLGIALNKQTFLEKLYENGSFIRSYLRTDGKLSDEAFNRLESQFNVKYKGVQNSHNTPILEEGLRYEDIRLNLNDLEILKSDKVTTGEISRWFNVPLDMLAGQESLMPDRSNFMLTSIAPMAAQIEQEITIKLLNESNGEYCRFDLLHNFRPGSVEKASYVTNLVNWGVFTQNEARALYGRNSKEGADDLRVDLNYIPQSFTEEYYTARINKMRQNGAKPEEQQPPK